MLTVYPHDLTPEQTPDALLTMGLGRLYRPYKATVKQKINGDWCLRITYPANAPEAALIQPDNLVACDGQLYRILRVTQGWGSKGKEINAEAPHVIYDLRDYFIENIETREDENYIDGINARQALEQLLAGTPFSVGTVDVPLDKLDYLEVLQKNVMEVIKEQILKLWGGELVPDNWTIHLRAQMGADRRYPIRHRMNIDEIECTVDIEPVITRLHVRGYEGANFEQINDGKDYIDSPSIGLYRRVKEGYVDFPDDDDPQVLMEKGLEHLSTVDKPKITYRVKLRSLKRSPQYANYKGLEVFQLGDTAVIHHPYFNQDILVRCGEREFDANTLENLDVTLGNPDDKIMAAISSGAAAAETISHLVDNNGYLRAEKLAGPLNLVRVKNLVAEIINAVTAAFDNATIGSAFVQRLEGFVLDYVSGHFHELNVNWAEIEALHTQLLEVVRQATINWAKIEGIDAGSLLFRLGEGGKLYIDNLAVNEGNMVSLAVGQLMIAGPDGKFYQLVPGEEGSVTLTEAPVGPDNLPDGSIPPTKIIDNSITAQQINFTLLLGSEAMIGAIKSAHIDADEVWSSQAFFGKVTANHLAADVGETLNLESNQAIVARVKTQDLNAWARYDGEILELGKSGSVFLAQLGTQRLAFLVSGMEKAAFGYDRMYIDRAEVGILSLGRPITYEQHGYVDMEVKDGGLVMTWREADA